jgi:hypothetical protein
LIIQCGFVATAMICALAPISEASRSNALMVAISASRCSSVVDSVPKLVFRFDYPALKLPV